MSHLHCLHAISLSLNLWYRGRPSDHSDHQLWLYDKTDEASLPCCVRLSLCFLSPGRTAVPFGAERIRYGITTTTGRYRASRYVAMSHRRRVVLTSPKYFDFEVVCIMLVAAV